LLEINRKFDFVSAELNKCKSVHLEASKLEKKGGFGTNINEKVINVLKDREF